MKTDLHMHSRHSDGTQWPDELARDAKARGLEQVALTDHDCMEGAPEFLAACRDSGLLAWAGAEIDCAADETGRSSEVLAYFPAGRCERTRELLAGRMRARRNAAADMFASRFPQAPDAFADMVRLRLGGRQGLVPESALSHMRPHLLLYLKKSGLLPAGITSRRFKEDFFPSSPGRPRDCEAVSAVVQDGGLAVLAHPGKKYAGGAAEMLRRRGALESELRRLKSYGLWGVELYSYEPGSALDDEADALVREAAAGLGLRLTYGSDHHGPAREDDGLGSHRDSLGSFYGDLPALAADGFRRGTD